MFVIPETMINPSKTHKQKDTEHYQEDTRDDVDCPVLESVVVLISDSAIDTFVSELN
jgi:hypothetical protein